MSRQDSMSQKGEDFQGYQGSSANKISEGGSIKHLQYNKSISDNTSNEEGSASGRASQHYPQPFDEHDQLVRPEHLNFNCDSGNASIGNYKSLSPKEQTSRFMS